MKERPILFSAPMVQAILEGRKTQTRRVVKGRPLQWLTEHFFKPEFVACAENHLCPYGHIGDRLWVRESLGKKLASFLGIEATNGVESAYYISNGDDVLDENGFNFCPWWKKKLLPAIHMPRWASRINLEITGVRIERLQDISEADAKAEGTPEDLTLLSNSQNWVMGFHRLWVRINGLDSWNQNPWVWVIEFKRLEETK